MWTRLDAIHPNNAGRMLEHAYPVDELVFRQFNAKQTPEEKSFPSSPGVDSKSHQAHPIWNMRSRSRHSKHAIRAERSTRPHGVDRNAGERLVMLYEISPGRSHDLHEMGVRIPQTRIPRSMATRLLAGEGDTRWSSATMVALDTRMRIIGAGGGGWFPSDQEHIVERITRTSKNYLTYQITIEDPLVLAKPWKSADRKWTLAHQNAHDTEWGEVFCTLNQEPEEYEKITDAKSKPK